MEQETKEETLLNLKTVSDLFGMSFFIPAYQRGYRWGKRQVEDLLNDINDFSISKEFAQNNENKIPNKFYCLQPVAVKTIEGENTYEVIDGQQRLTTLYILLKYLKSVKQIAKEVNLYSITYQTRENSKDFLNCIECKVREKEKSEEDYESIDFHYMAEAYNTIKEWFNKDNISKNFVDILLNHVKVIWYEVDKSCNAYDIFSRLNSGKIPLTNAELVKALLLQASNFKSNEANFKKIQIASEWDTIEKTLQDDAFWFFISNGTKKDDNRIDYILELVAQKTNKNNEYQTFIHFDEVHKGINGKEQKNAEIIWKDIKNCFAILEEWYIDHTLYHYIGYLINNGTLINELIEMTKNEENTKTKSDFVKAIKKKIKDDLQCIAMTKNEGEEEYKALGQFLLENSAENKTNQENKIIEEIFNKNSFNIYENNENEQILYGNGKVKKVLLLFNIESILQSKETYIRFPFNLYKDEKNGWDIEHIVSQTDKIPENDDDKKTWLRQINEYFKTINLEEFKEEELNKKIEKLKDDIEEFITNIAEFTALFEKVNEHFNNEDFKHHIGNLTLLNPSINRSYGNAFFPIKRQTIIDKDKAGEFIPLTTKNVFLKYYSKIDVANITSWTANDAKEYENTICEVLIDFLS